MNQPATYLNTAACGLVPATTIAAANQLYTALETKGSIRAEQWRMHEESAIRNNIASFLNAPADTIAMIPNFSWALNGVVQSLKGTERVLLYRNDYPSFIEPFRINSFDITWTEPVENFAVNEEEVKQHIKNKKVDIVALSHVQWSSGYKIDLQAIGDLCKEYGVLFIVDATQSMGAHAIDLNVLNIDVFIASNYKWMNAGFGTGIMSIKKSFLEKYVPVVGGHNSYQVVGNDWKYVPSALSYEPGHPNMYGLTVLNAAIDHKMKLGVSEIEQHNRQLTQFLLDQLKTLDLPISILGDYTMDHRASIIFLKDEHGLGEHVKQHHIIVTHRNGYLRISMHYYNSENDIVTLINCLKDFK